MIGMDGAHLGAFARGWTPRISSALDKADKLPVVEDLITRGWFRIATGHDAKLTGSLYDRPQLEGGAGWTLNFSMAKVPGFGDSVKPIWQVLSEAGIRVGIMNLPTIFPAPAVNGFFVSGGGGGAPVVRAPLAGHCYPEEILPRLEEIDYIVDERPNTLLGDGQMKTPREVFERLAYKNARRVDAFLELSKQHEIDFGFVVFKSSSVIAELLVLPEMESSKRSGQLPDKDLMFEAERYYREFDEQVGRLMSENPDAEILIVSDHGSVVPDIAFNPNALLKKLGFQRRSSLRGSMASVVRTTKALVPYSIRLKLKKSKAIKARWNSLAVAPPQGSLAFSAVVGSWRNGVFINDMKRFGGPVKAEEVAELALRITAALKEDPELKKYHVSAQVAAELGDKKLPFYPDIVFSMPDSVCMSPANGKVFSPFRLPPAPLGLTPLFEGKQLAVKSGNALAANLTHSWLSAEADEECDLTSVYQHVLQRFEVSAISES